MVNEEHGGETPNLHAALTHELSLSKRVLEAIDALSYVDESTDVLQMAHRTIQILQGIQLTDFDDDDPDGAGEDAHERLYPRPPLPGDIVENIAVPGLDWRSVLAVTETHLVLDLGPRYAESPEEWTWIPIDRFEVRVPRSRRG